MTDGIGWRNQDGTRKTIAAWRALGRTWRELFTGGAFCFGGDIVSVR